jgi:hypothetical protein
MSTEFQSTFAKFTGNSSEHGGTLRVKEDTLPVLLKATRGPPHYVLGWQDETHGDRRRLGQIGEAYVSYHLVPVYGNATLRDEMSRVEGAYAR